MGSGGTLKYRNVFLFVPRSKSVLLACLSGSETDSGVRTRPAGRGACLPAGRQLRVVCVGHLAALRAAEGPGL